jgi:hypothetical protein
MLLLLLPLLPQAGRCRCLHCCQPPRQHCRCRPPLLPPQPPPGRLLLLWLLLQCC